MNRNRHDSLYVEIGSAERRISKESVQSFLDWTREAAARANLLDPKQLAVVRGYHQRALTFSQNLLAKANAQ